MNDNSDEGSTTELGYNLKYVNHQFKGKVNVCSKNTNKKKNAESPKRTDSLFVLLFKYFSQ